MCKNTNLEIEEFRKIPSLWLLYEVNQDGTIIRNVKSKKRLKIKKDMHHSQKGYMTTFCNIKNKVYRIMVHKVVAECWLGEKPDGTEIDHINRDSLDNRYTNLRYVTHSEQMKNRVLSDKIINTAKSNCAKWVKHGLGSAVLVDGIKFNSKGAAARYILESKSNSESNSVSIHSIKCRLTERRKNILGHEITYLTNSLIAETRYDDHCAQLGKE